MTATLIERTGQREVQRSITTAKLGQPYSVTLADAFGGATVQGVYRGLSILGLTAGLFDILDAPAVLNEWRVAARMYRLPYYLIARMVEA